MMAMMETLDAVLKLGKEAVNNTLNYKARLTVDLLLSNFRI
jgi:hypothetical protein